VAVRLGLLAVCVAAIAVMAVRLRDQDGCQAARKALFAAGVGGGSTGPPAAQVRALRADCHDVDDLSAGAVSVLLSGDGRDAVRIAREATRRGPDVFSAWVALEAAQRRADPAAAKRAEARARALNPRWSGPAPLPAPRGGAGP
jgi:hypothetical protein